MKKILPPILLFLVFQITLSKEIFGQQLLQEQTQLIAEKLKKDDWNAVNEYVKKLISTNIFTCDTEPVIRFLYGHSALAIGKNNDAMNQFYCVGDTMNSESLKKWYDWTKRLSMDNSENSNAQYLYGDALARKELYLKASIEFDKAIRLNSKNSMALNARGVNRWIIVKMIGEKACESCTKDWEKATKHNPLMADAFVNRGVAQLLVGGTQDYCRKYFNKGLENDPIFALAHNGIKVAFHSQAPDENYFDYVKKNNEIITLSPFGKLDLLIFGLDSIREARGMSYTTNGLWDVGKAAFGLGWNIGSTFDNFIQSGTFSSMDIDNLYNSSVNLFDRGGVFSIKNEYNSTTRIEGYPSQTGTWFLLNYPSRKWKIE